MNVATLIVSKDEAMRKLDQYNRIQQSRRTEEDEALRSLYAAVSRGARCLNVAEAFKQVGLNEKSQPKLAMARADWKTVHCFRDAGAFNGTVAFGPAPRLNPQAKTQNIYLPGGIYAWPTRLAVTQSYQYRVTDVSWSKLRTQVPHVPPNVRPRFKLSNYHILFEVKAWEEYNVDPFLLRRIAGHLYVVEAEWELTELEASLLKALTGN